MYKKEQIIEPDGKIPYQIETKIIKKGRIGLNIKSHF